MHEQGPVCAYEPGSALPLFLSRCYGLERRTDQGFAKESRDKVILPVLNCWFVMGRLAGKEENIPIDDNDLYTSMVCSSMIIDFLPEWRKRGREVDDCAVYSVRSNERETVVKSDRLAPPDDQTHSDHRGRRSLLSGEELVIMLVTSRIAAGALGGFLLLAGYEMM